VKITSAFSLSIQIICGISSMEVMSGLPWIPMETLKGISAKQAMDLLLSGYKGIFLSGEA
jgi:hypothetical protein